MEIISGGNSIINDGAFNVSIEWYFLAPNFQLPYMRRWVPVTISIKQEDTMPALKLRLKDSVGNPVNLTGATVRAVIQHYLNSDISFDRAVHVADAANGEVWIV